MVQIKEYTITEIANYGMTLFGIDPEMNKDSVRSAIARSIKKLKIEPVGKKLVGKTTAKTFSEETLKLVIFDLKIEYFQDHERGEDPIEILGMKELNELLDEQIDIRNEFNEEYAETMSKNDDSSYTLEVSDDDFRNKKLEVMIEALFSQKFILKEEQLIKDMTNNLYGDEFFNQSKLKQIEIDASLKRLKDNKNYYDDIK